ncbi:MAG: ATP-binding protein, partial [Pseudomonadota bacterium]
NLAIRNITHWLTNIDDSELKSDVAQQVAMLYEQSNLESGFLELAFKNHANLLKINGLLEKNTTFGQQTNQLLTDLIQVTTRNFNQEIADFDDVLEQSKIVLIILVVIVIGLFLGCMYGYVLPKITRRLQQLTIDTQLISEGRYEIAINYSGDDEISLLAKSLDGFKSMLKEKQRVESEREKLIEKLMKSNEELERFAYICSHDLQEPLRMIRSFSTKLKERLKDKLEGDETTLRYFRFITEGAENAQNLIQDILDYARINNSTEAFSQVNTKNMVLSIKENMQFQLEAAQARLTFDSLPTVIANETQIYQLLSNLINNGLKYQKKERIPRVHIACEEKKHHWQFSVKDNGIGIERRHHEKIFQIFQRLNRKSLFSGTGIGLAICKKIMERHEGKIWVESDGFSGSVFYFTLPKNHDMDENE